MRNSLTLFFFTTILFSSSQLLASEIISYGGFEIELLDNGDTATGGGGYDDGTLAYDRTITGTASWTYEQRAAVIRSLDVLNNSFEGTYGRQMRIAIAFRNDLPPGVLGGSGSTKVFERSYSEIISTGELLWRDGSSADYFPGIVDDVIQLSANLPWHFGSDAPGNGLFDFQTVVTHEIIHAMGVSNGYFGTSWGYANGITKWDSLMQDINGNIPLPGTFGTPGDMAVIAPEGTVYWIGEHANATYGGHVPIYTSSTEYRSGSSLSHPGINGELMYWAVSDMLFNRAPNKLLLDMYRDMGWAVNEKFYSNFGPTFYGNNRLISHQGSFSSHYDYTYAMYLNGSGNQINQSGSLKTYNSFSRALSVYGHVNELNISGTLLSVGDYSQGLYLYGYDNTITHQGTILAAGEGSTAIHMTGSGNTLFHSGTTSATSGADAIRVDNKWNGETFIHILDGSIIQGDIWNSTPNVSSKMTFGYQFSSEGKAIGTDSDFTFFYDDDVRGEWDYHIGAGTLHLGRNGSMEGYVYNNGTFQEDGEVYGNIYNRGVLKGNGTTIGDVDNHGVISPGNSIGTLTVNGSYTHGSGAIFIAEIDKNGSSDLLYVTGKADIKGGTVVTNLPRALYTDGYSWNFLQASGGMTGEFASLTGQPHSSILNLSLGYTPTQANIEVNRKSYASFVSNKGAQSIGYALDSYVPYAVNRGDVMENLLIAMDFDYSPAGIASTLSGLNPEIYPTFLAVEQQSALRFSQNMSQRSSLTRDLQKFNLEEIIENTEITVPQASGGELKVESHDPNWLVWGKAQGASVIKDTTIDYNGYDLKTGGAVIGADREVSETINFGMAAAFEKTDVEWEQGAGGTQDSIMVGLYGEKQYGDYYFDAQGSIGLYDNNSSRVVAFGNYVSQENTDFDGQSYLIRLGGGYDFQYENVLIGPLASLSYLYLRTEDFSETGDSDLSLKVDDSTENVFVSYLGIHTASKFQVVEADMSARIDLVWQHDFNDDEFEMDGWYNDYQSFTFSGPGVDQDMLVATAEATLSLGKQLYAYAEVGGALGSEVKAYNASIGLQWFF